MAKKALVSTIEPRGKDNSGYRVLEVVDAANTFEVHPNLQWHDCLENLEAFKYWYNPVTDTFKKLPDYVEQSTAGELAVNDEGILTEAYEWDWDNEVWTKVQIINQ
jgi:hypothetical protein